MQTTASAPRHGIATDDRCALLRRLLNDKPCLRVLEAHSPLAALLVESATASGAPPSRVRYDAFWSSSLTDSSLRGKPDIEVLDVRNRLDNIDDIFDVTSSPLIMDGDTGGKLEHFEINVRSLERRGVSAVIIEDKIGLKKNSLLGTQAQQQQDTIENFCAKIAAGKAAQRRPDFMIFARVESLILEAGMADALERARAYVAAGADGILIHSRHKTPTEVFRFADTFRARHPHTPLACVPTSFNGVHFDELQNAGFNVVIYANHMLRAAYVAMQRAAADILRHGRTQEIEAQCLDINDLLSLIPGTR